MSAGRRWVFRLMSLVLIPLVVLVAGELTLRMAGYGYSTGFFKKAQIGDSEYLVDNDNFGLRFFPPTLARFPAPIVLGATKAPGTFRIFIFGESAALGDPRPNFGAGRYLEVLLRERFPEGKFEVVNTGMTAINSHVIGEIAGDCERLDGDCWIVFMGNNEMVGPFGAATVFGRQAPPLWVVRLTLEVQKSRLGQLFVEASRRIRGSSGQASWQGMQMFLRNRVRPSDPRKEAVCRNFQANLQDILRAGRRAGANIVLNTVAVNLADCPPFASGPGENGSGKDVPGYKVAWEEGNKAAERRDWGTAVESFRKAAAACPDSAEAHFRLAECLLALTNTAAGEHFAAAADMDLLPFRADSRLNGIIREAAKTHAGGGTLALCDAALWMATNNPAGVPGKESFFEHVHFNFDGNYRLARLWAEQVVNYVPSGMKRGGTAEWAPQEQCEKLLGLTDWNRLSTLGEMIDRLAQPPFTGQPGNEQRLAGLRAWAEQLGSRTNAAAAQKAAADYVEALRRAPDDYPLHQNYAEFLEATGGRAQAIAELRKVCELIPHYYFPWFQLGCALKRDGKVPEAKQELLKAAALLPRSGEVRVELGMVYGRGGEWDKALGEFELAHKFSPEDPRVPLYTGEVLRKLNRRVDAAESFREAIRMKPDYWEAHYRLGEEFANQRQLADAAREFQATLNVNPNYVRAHVALAVVLKELGRAQESSRHLEEALRLDPANKEAQAILRQTGR